MPVGLIKRYSLASLLLVLSACSTLPVPELPVSPAAPAPARPAAKRPSAPPIAVPRPDLAPLSDARPNEQALLNGEAPRELERGEASWYGARFQGRRTASGERFNMHGLTAAHKTLPFGTVVRVRGLLSGREIEVRINDRGPFSHGRVIDLSRAAAEAIGMIDLGVKDVLLLVPESTPLLPGAK